MADSTYNSSSSPLADQMKADAAPKGAGTWLQNLPAIMTGAGSLLGVFGVGSGKPPRAMGNLDPVPTNFTAPPRTAPKPKTSPWIWVAAGVGVLILGYILLRKK